MVFRSCVHHHHLPCMQEQAGGGFFMVFRHPSCHRHLPCMQQQARGVFLWRLDAVCTIITSLASQRWFLYNLLDRILIESYIKLVSCMFSTIYFCFMSLEPGMGFLNPLNPQKSTNLTKPLP